MLICDLLISNCLRFALNFVLLVPKILEMARSVAGGHQPICRYSRLHRHSSYIKGIEVIVSNIFCRFFVVFFALDPEIYRSCLVLKVYGPKKCLAILTKNELLGCNNFYWKAFFVVLNGYFSLFEFCLFLFPGVDLRLIFVF